MKLTTSDLNKLSVMAKSAAIEAGHYIQSQVNQVHTQSRKDSDLSLASQVVTEVDIKAQEIILSHLNDSIQAYDLGLLTEELTDDQSRITKDYFWCIDPLDGTLAFTERKPGYAVSIALVSKEGDPVIGVVYVPNREECYSSVKGKGVLLNDQLFKREEKISDDVTHVFLDRSILKEKYFPTVKTRLDKSIKNLNNQRVEYHTSYGAVCNALGVMTSSQGCYFKLPKKKKGGGSIWDFAATRLFFEELGLWVSDANGKRLYLNDPNTTFMNKEGVLFATEDCLEFVENNLTKMSEEENLFMKPSKPTGVNSQPKDRD